MYKCIIIGCGVHGITMANYLLKLNKVTQDELLIIDPHTEPLANWHRCTNTISMPFLRSPGVHHLDIHPLSLEAYAKNNQYNENSSFLGRLKRASLLLFEEHCNCLIENLTLKECWKKGFVKTLNRNKNGWQIELETNQIFHSQNLVLAIGNSNQLQWPDWAIALKAQSEDQVHHIFDSPLPSVKTMKPPFTVIGGGITAVHLTLKLNSLFPKQVTLLKRHPFRIHDFDSDPGWLGPKKQTAFRKTRAYQNRREQIIKARNKGSIPRDLYIKLLYQKRGNNEIVVDGQVYEGDVKDGMVNLYDESNHLLQRSGTVLLATGFQALLPGEIWLTPVIEENHLECAACGYPIVTKNLQWGPNLYVMDGLAELETRPIARNISGARQAAECIVQAL
ncbi:FAD/NAD(P)-binding protein [Planococcus sp. CAU13]|uniref:FAD/NAD(P)-binding protein n=1 Tax=Planococcus sp. CAU13 TaxID=1541197 RepID=UPI00052FE402|nr:FAD/NAD(P)-binding protein [Planococcus sp. CAU13]